VLNSLWIRQANVWLAKSARHNCAIEVLKDALMEVSGPMLKYAQAELTKETQRIR
jgi:hypothetical protein